MSLVILCVGKRTEIPYCIPVTGMNIYSVEELCYFFGENAFLLDDSIVNKSLIDWLENQCELPELADILYTIYSGEKDLEQFVRAILEYTGYFDSQTAEKVLSALRDCSGRSVGERKKTRADYFLENGKYELAICEYEILLREREKECPTLFDGTIYKGMGCAFAKMFLFEQADYYFEKAYGILKDDDVLFKMLGAKRLYLPEQDYICYIADNPEFFDISQELEEKLNAAEKMWSVSERKKQLDDLKECKNVGEAQLYYDEIERMTNRLKESFRKCLRE